MGLIGSARKDHDYTRLHHPDGSHRTTARSANDAERAWFEENSKLHMEQHEMQDEQQADSLERLRALPRGHRLYTRVVKVHSIDGRAHVIVRYPSSASEFGLTIQWVNVDPALISCERSPEAGAYILDDSGIDAGETIVMRLGEAIHGDRGYFYRYSL